jgi:hypothetical protein
LPGTESVVHNVVLQADSEVAFARPAEDPMYADLCEALATCHRELSAGFSPLLTEIAAANPESAARLETLASEADSGAILAHAHRFCRALIPSAAGEGSSA